MSELKEIAVPYIVEDFEAGDRVYRFTPANAYILFGTVQHVDTKGIQVKMDTGAETMVPIQYFKSIESVEIRSFYWGKTLPLNEVKVGSIISASLFGVKQTATVNKVSDGSITFTYNEGYRITNTYTESQTESLERLLMFWELED